jgi:aminoglycoside phosphotransferase (APT) family kinase protein
MYLEKPIATGNTAEVYLHDGKIIKLFKELLPDKQGSYEANKQRYAYDKGLPVPKIYDVINIAGKQAIIMEYIPGDSVGSMILNDETKVEGYMSLSVDIQLKIHDIKASDFELMEDKLKQQLLFASALTEKQKDALIEKLHRMQYEKRLCHGDYHVFNLLLNKKGITIIDWVDSSAGDVKADACRSYLLYSQFAKELADLYLRLYAEKSGLSQEDIFAWKPILAGARLSENIASKEANQLIEIVNQYCPA